MRYKCDTAYIIFVSTSSSGGSIRFIECGSGDCGVWYATISLYPNNGFNMQWNGLCVASENWNGGLRVIGSTSVLELSKRKGHTHEHIRLSIVEYHD